MTDCGNCPIQVWSHSEDRQQQILTCGIRIIGRSSAKPTLSHFVSRKQSKAACFNNMSVAKWATAKRGKDRARWYRPIAAAFARWQHWFDVDLNHLLYHAPLSLVQFRPQCNHFVCWSVAVMITSRKFHRNRSVFERRSEINAEVVTGQTSGERDTHKHTTQIVTRYCWQIRVAIREMRSTVLYVLLRLLHRKAVTSNTVTWQICMLTCDPKAKCVSRCCRARKTTSKPHTYTRYVGGMSFPLPAWHTVVVQTVVCKQQHNIILSNCEWYV